MPRGRPRKKNKLPPLFLDPNLEVPDYLKHPGKRIKLGKVRGWKAVLDWDYSACDELTQALLNPRNLEQVVRDLHADRIWYGIQRKLGSGKTPNQNRKEKSEERIKAISAKYSDCFSGNNYSHIARCIERRMIKNDDPPPKFRTLRKYVSIIKKVGTANLIKN